ncbi:MAG: Ig-like domain-containing protein [Motilibacteraceae bacterium]
MASTGRLPDRGLPGRRLRRRGAGLVLIAVAGLLATSGCQPAATGQAAAQRPAAPAVSSAPVPVSLHVTPADAATGVRPDAAVQVSATHGTLTSVQVLAAGAKTPLSGALSADKASWRADEPLLPGTTYVVSTEAVGKTGSVRQTSSFRTLTPTGKLTTSITPLSGRTYGVGMPIVITFDARVKDKAAVQRRLTVTSSKPVQGSWHWDSDTVVEYRPQTYWPAYTSVTVGVRLKGVDGGGGAWGVSDRTVRFEIGSATISKVDVKKLTMTVYRDGSVLKVVPVTTGKDGFLTRNGVKVISEKHRTIQMDAATLNIPKDSKDYYNLKVEYALRVTWSGEFVHAAPWSVGQQGSARVSHGCVGMSMADGAWFFDQSKVGDVIEVSGSPRQLEPGNGWTLWNVPWAQWQAGSAL